MTTAGARSRSKVARRRSAPQAVDPANVDVLAAELARITEEEARLAKEDPEAFEAQREAWREAEKRAAPAEVLGAATRAERMIEHLRSFIQAARGGVKGRRDRDHLRKLAGQVDRMWRVLSRTDENREVVMRFLHAIDFAAKLSDATARGRFARETFCARFPDHDDEELSAAFDEGLLLWRGSARWHAMLALVERTIGAQTFESGEALRVEYKRWRSRLKS